MIAYYIIMAALTIMDVILYSRLISEIDRLKKQVAKFENIKVNVSEVRTLATEIGKRPRDAKEPQV